MENSNIRINLSSLVHIVTSVKGKSGNQVEGVFIPFEKNNIFKGQKGLYLDLIAFPIKNKQTDSKDTHLIKQSFSKEQREKMGKEEADNLPIVGNMIDWNYVQRGNTDTDLQDNTTINIPAEDDLPF